MQLAAAAAEAEHTSLSPLTTHTRNHTESTVKMPPLLALGGLLACLLLTCPAILFSGWLCDKPRVPRMVVALTAYAAMAAMCVPMFYGE